MYRLVFIVWGWGIREDFEEEALELGPEGAWLLLVEKKGKKARWVKGIAQMKKNKTKQGFSMRDHKVSSSHTKHFWSQLLNRFLNRRTQRTRRVFITRGAQSLVCSKQNIIRISDCVWRVANLFFLLNSENKLGSLEYTTWEMVGE